MQFFVCHSEDFFTFYTLPGTLPKTLSVSVGLCRWRSEGVRQSPDFACQLAGTACGYPKLLARLNGFFLVRERRSLILNRQRSLALIQILHLQWVELDCPLTEETFFSKQLPSVIPVNGFKVGLRSQCLLSHSSWSHKKFVMAGGFLTSFKRKLVSHWAKQIKKSNFNTLNITASLASWSLCLKLSTQHQP